MSLKTEYQAAAVSSVQYSTRVFVLDKMRVHRSVLVLLVTFVAAPAILTKPLFSPIGCSPILSESVTSQPPSSVPSSSASNTNSTISCAQAQAQVSRSDPTTVEPLPKHSDCKGVDQEEWLRILAANNQNPAPSNPIHQQQYAVVEMSLIDKLGFAIQRFIINLGMNI